MLDPIVIYKKFLDLGIEFFTGVPDSLLKDFCLCVSEKSEGHAHVIAANEGGAVGLAAGHHLGTGKCGLVYLQNSGLGNMVNPLLSLADDHVYGLPMVLMVGWRGEPDVKDEPQHVRQGEVTESLLDVMGVESCILPVNEEEALACISMMYGKAVKEEKPVALVVRKGSFSKYTGKVGEVDCSLMSRERAIEIVVDGLEDTDVVVSTTGKTSRELFEIREERGECGRDFMTVGSMGHCSQIALGVALSRPDKRVICMDGDGSALMHLGGLALVGQSSISNFVHVLLNNGAHDSVGGQPTVGLDIDFCGMASSLGYSEVLRCEAEEDLVTFVKGLNGSSGRVFVEVMVACGSMRRLNEGG